MLLRATRQVKDEVAGLDATDVLVSTGHVANSHLAHLSVKANPGKWKVLANRIIPLWRRDGNSGGRIVTFSYKKPFVVRYNGTTENDIEKNGVYLMAFTNQGSTESPVWTVAARTRFYDN